MSVANMESERIVEGNCEMSNVHSNERGNNERTDAKYLRPSSFVESTAIALCFSSEISFMFEDVPTEILEQGVSHSEWIGSWRLCTFISRYSFIPCALYVFIILITVNSSFFLTLLAVLTNL